MFFKILKNLNKEDKKHDKKINQFYRGELLIVPHKRKYNF